MENDCNYPSGKSMKFYVNFTMRHIKHNKNFTVLVNLLYFVVSNDIKISWAPLQLLY